MAVHVEIRICASSLGVYICGSIPVRVCLHILIDQNGFSEVFLVRTSPPLVTFHEPQLIWAPQICARLQQASTASLSARLPKKLADFQGDLDSSPFPVEGEASTLPGSSFPI